MYPQKPGLSRPRQVEAPDPYSERVRSERVSADKTAVTALTVLRNEPETFPDSDDEQEAKQGEAAEPTATAAFHQQLAALVSPRASQTNSVPMHKQQGILSSGRVSTKGFGAFTSKMRSSRYRKKKAPRLTTVTFANDGKPLELRTFEVILPIVARKRTRERQMRHLELQRQQSSCESSPHLSSAARSVTPSQKSDGIFFADDESENTATDVVARPALAADLRRVPRQKPNTNTHLTDDEAVERAARRRMEVRSIELDRFELRTSREARLRLAENGFILRERFTPGDVALRRKVGHIASIDRKWTVPGNEAGSDAPPEPARVAKCLTQYATKLLADEFELEQMPAFERRLAADTVVWCVTETAEKVTKALAPQPPAGVLPLGGIAPKAEGADSALTKLAPLPTGLQVAAEGVECEVRSKSCFGCFGGVRVRRAGDATKERGAAAPEDTELPVVFNIKGIHLVLDTLELSIAASGPDVAHARAVALATSLREGAKLRRFTRRNGKKHQ